MQAAVAARIFHDWAYSEGLLTELAAPTTSSPAEAALIQPVTDLGKTLLRSKQVQAVAFNGPRSEIIVFTKRAAPTNKKQLQALPSAVDDVQVRYRQGVQHPVDALPVAPFGGPTYVIRHAGQADRYSCGSSISVGNSREAGTMGCLVRDAQGSLYGLTNNHISGSCSFAGVGLPILAPGVVDVVPGCVPPFTIGFHANSLPFLAGSADNVNPKDNLDAAMFRIRDEGLVSSFQRADYDTPANAAPLAADLEVEKVGRTTGHTRGKVIGEMFGACGIPYSAALYGFSGIVSFEPVFTIAGHGGLFSDAGDSGSLITTIDQNGQRYAVGIVIGGRVDGSAAGGKTTIALPISPILQGLGVNLVSGHNI
jgi:hypothetical protein